MITFIKKHKEKIFKYTVIIILSLYFYVTSIQQIYLVWVNGADQHSPHRQTALLLLLGLMYDEAKKSKKILLIIDYILSFLLNLVLLIVILIKS